MSIIELSQLGQDLFDFSDLKCLQTKSNYNSILLEDSLPLNIPELI